MTNQHSEQEKIRDNLRRTYLRPEAKQADWVIFEGESRILRWAEIGPELLTALEDAEKALKGHFGPAGVMVTVRKAIEKARELQK